MVSGTTDGGQTLLVACDDEDREAAEAVAVSGTDAVVRVATDLDQLVQTLCFETVDCLLVTPSVDGTSGANVARGVRGLFPDLPIVVVGIDPEIALELDVTDAGTSITDVAVREVIRARLDADVSSAAARPPSRLETLAMAMFAEFPDHLYAKDDDARHVLTNDRSVPIADAIGLTDFEVESGPDEEHAEKTVRDDWRVIEDGKPVIEVEEYTTEDGEYALTSKVPWRDADGEVTGLVGITRDISSRKDREQELRRQNERLAKVALVAAHELRNELQVATGRLDYLREDPYQAEVVTESLDRQVSIVDDVVALTAQERRVLDTQEVWISTPAHEVWESLSTGSATMDVVEDCRIVADLEALRLLFDILLSNAVEHGGPGVRVTVSSTTEGFFVADDGSGIDVDPPERVFDAGFAGTDETPGFGLYVARRIANDHGWSLRATNRPEGGARFDVRTVSDQA